MSFYFSYLRYVTALWMFASSFVGFCQGKKTDSLLTQLKFLESKPASISIDTTKVRLLNQLCRSWTKDRKPEKAMKCVEEALKLSEAIIQKGDFSNLPLADQQKIRELEALSLLGIGNVHNELTQSVQAFRYYSKAAKIHEEYGRRNLALSNIYFATAQLYFKKGDFNESLEFHLKALKIRDELGDKKAIAGSYHNIGNIYNQKNDLDKALEFYFKGLQIRREMGDSVGVANLYNNIGLMYGEKNDRSKQRTYMFLSLKMKEQLGDIAGVASTYVNVANIYRDIADSALKAGNTNLFHACMKNAEVFAGKALKAHEYANNPNGIANVYILRGSIAKDQKKYNDAGAWYNKSLDLSKRLDAKSLMRGAYVQLSSLYKEIASSPLTAASKKTEYWKKAFEYQGLLSSIKDSIFNQENIRAMADMQTRYDTDKKDNEILLLNKDKEKQKAESEKQRTIIWSVVAGLLLVIVFAAFVFRSLRVTKKQKLIIEKQKSEVERSKHIIEEKNKDITDSITYALRIQQARLPRMDEIRRVFPESFVLFKPKDIVSGDFYYFHVHEERALIAAADCTGHGVPGAFMSMIGSERLDDAVMIKKEPSDILSHLNVSIKASLKQTDTTESTKDGMDIALCSLDLKSGLLKYAGANRPIWIIKKDENVIIEIKATKTAIGGHTSNDQKFEMHTLEMGKGDSFYIFSDGYADSFGGENGKKLTTKRFRDVLLSIQNKSLNEQGKYLGEFINNWSAGNVQIDDILVIGVRV